MRGWPGECFGLICICLCAVGIWPAASASASEPRPRLVLKGAPVRHGDVCGRPRRALVTGSSVRVVAHLATGTRTMHVERCGPNRTWQRSGAVRRRSPVRTRLRLPELKPGDYRIRVSGLRAAYLRVLWPLLDRAKIRAPMTAFCDGPNGDGPRRPDHARLPIDPRKLLAGPVQRPDVAAVFNAPWIDLHNAPGFRPHPVQHPTTCGGFRRWVREGRAFIRTRPFFQLIAGADAYDNLWRAWGLTARPGDFDRQVIQRYGLNQAPFRNPYPKPGEDPGKTSGGSGQLPLGLIQGRARDDSYNGKVTITCSACHDSILGTPEDGLGLYHGRGSDGLDASLLAFDLGRAAAMIGRLAEPGAIVAGLLPYPYSAGRGVTNAFGTLDFLALFDMETLDFSPGAEVFPVHGAAGQVQTPNWWNRSHRTRMFMGGELSGDNARVSMALAVANVDRSGADIKVLEPRFERVHVFLESLSPPRYRRKVDTALAKRGAILFHTRDLRPPTSGPSTGNGSCASCHGVYSPRYANNARFLPDPRLKGIEGYVAPLGVIGTDPARTRIVNEQFERAWNTSWWGYDDLNPKWTPEGQGRRGTTFERALYDYGVTGDRLAGPNRWDNDPVGYEAPPLYGIWASAPYFHNGSVPTVRGVLRPAARPAVWRRLLSKPGEGGITQGYDTSLHAYDLENLGYKYTNIPCDRQVAGDPVPCHPEGSPLSVVEGELSKLLGPDVFLTNQVPPPITEQDRRRRMIYNTHEYSMGNAGHDFTRRLSDRDVDAILEYLKTL